MSKLLKPIAYGLFATTLTMPIVHADTDFGKGSATSNQVIELFAKPEMSGVQDEETVKIGDTRSLCDKSRGITVSCGTTKKIKHKPQKPPQPLTSSTENEQSCPEVAISMEILFDYKSDQLNATAMEQLRPFGEALASQQLQGNSYRVEGHTDAIGGEAYNNGLSLRRAEAVKNYLKYQFSFSGKDIRAVGKGKSQLADPGNPSSEKNRRVRIIKTSC